MEELMIVFKRSIKDIVNIWKDLQKKYQQIVNKLLEKQELLKKCLEFLKQTLEDYEYCWQTQNEIPYAYTSFDIGFKQILHLYEFLYEKDLKRQKDNQQVKEGLNNQIDQFSKDENSEHQLSEVLVKPELSKMVSKETHKQGILLEGSKSSIDKDILSDQFDQDFCFSDLIDIIKKQFLLFIYFSIENDRFNNLSKWENLCQMANKDNKSFQKLDIKSKLSQISAQAKFEAKRRLPKVQQNKNFNIYLNIDREYIWSDTIKEVSKKNGPQLALSELNVKFKKEEGIDGGGLTREWLTLTLRQIFNPDFGLFTLSSNQVTLRPSPLSYVIPSHLKYFEYAGRLVAKGLMEQIEVEVDFTVSFLKHILKKNLIIQDLEDIDPEQAKNLHWILENDINELDLTFSYDINKFGTIETIELVENGSNVIVTNDNKQQFVKLMAHYKMTDEIKEQIQKFIQGFYDVIPYKAIEHFDEKDFGMILSGIKQIDINEMKQFIGLQGYTQNSDQIEWLFDFLSQQDEQIKALFLFYATGSFKVPYGGYSSLGLEIVKVSNTKKLPVAHTCSKQIDLPPYESRQILEQKLLTAIQEGHKGFYIG
ncbi:HECT-domain-containing protein [Pseudocohnilembus persalinus]|uniref:HECT-type E3 ubiquitin transferase n=1 Tax=Pseudocohnilembus persalinus TaxID=266149 RepID=A0A0V0QG42_PSEPJ|nr:HECT-domain-containing protein [Pseudocohnilembus persalinus]|eukprot:KRX01040.1 HECT-domain-containing protein [Pseudocohnilembus persalinus]